MLLLTTDSYRKLARTTSGNKAWRWPQSVDVQCPLCGRLSNFRLEASAQHLFQERPVRVSCSGCQGSVRFFIVGADDAVDPWGGEVWMYPAGPHRRVLPVDDALPPRLAKGYADAVMSLQHRLWRASATTTRTVLEGIVATHVPSDNPREGLGRRLRRLADHMDLTAPVKAVADVLRDGGNVAAHFDEGRDVDAAMAQEMLDLLEAFIDYLFLLPARAEGLRVLLAGPGTDVDGPGT